LTSGAIYNHFASKDELFIATAVHMTSVNLAAIEDAVAAGGGWRAMLARMLRLVRDDATGWFGYPLLTTAVQLKMLQNRDLFAEMLALRQAYAVQFERIVAAAIDAGDLPATLPRAIAGQLLMGFIFNGMGTVISHHQGKDAVHAIVDTAAVLLGAGKP
jgi:AcrR family transcriptional regulator